jgi:hypothetical protein
MRLNGSIVRTFVAVVLIACLAAPDAAGATLQPQTLRAWGTYVQLTEKRIASELDGQRSFLAMDFKSASDTARMRSVHRSGQVYVEKLKTFDASGKDVGVDGGMIHHWFGSVFIPNITTERLIQWIQDYDQHSRYFKEVERSRLVSREGDTFRIFLRLVREKIVTVRYNTDHTVIYRHHDPARVSSRSFTTKIAELENAGTPSEVEKPIGDDRGFFWRLNSYWRFREEAGGVIVECESISLSRSLPFGLGWLIKGFVESVPRESLQTTLLSIREGVGLAMRGQ